MNFYKIDAYGDKHIANLTNQMNQNNNGGNQEVNTKAEIDRVIWGNADDGGDIMDTMFVNGSIYLNVGGYAGGGYNDEDDDDDDDDSDDDIGFTDAEDKVDMDSFTTRSSDEGGNLYASGHIESKTAEFKENSYSHEVYLNYPDSSGDKINVLELFKRIVPIGTIFPYAGSDSRETLKSWGFAVCDGTTPGVPDLRNKFLMGADIMGGTGGRSTVTLSVNNMPAHDHSATTTVELTKSADTDPSVPANLKDQIIVTQRETYYQVADRGGDKHYFSETGYEEPQDKGVIELTVGDIVNMANSGSDGTYTATATTTIDPEGDSEEFSIIPPYYTVVYIMRIS